MRENSEIKEFIVAFLARTSITFLLLAITMVIEYLRTSNVFSKGYIGFIKIVLVLWGTKEIWEIYKKVFKIKDRNES